MNSEPVLPVGRGESALVMPGMKSPYGGFWGRTVASFIDNFVIMVPIFVIYLVFDLPRITEDPMPEGSLPTLLLLAAVPFTYYSIMESSNQQASVGKRTLGLRVTDLRGARLSFSRAAGRASVWWLPGVAAILDYIIGLQFIEIAISLVVVASCIAVAFTARKQGFHDMLMGCLVVDRRAVFD